MKFSHTLHAMRSAMRVQPAALAVSLTLLCGSAAAFTNGTMLQYFDWDTPADGLQWNRVRDNASTWVSKGVTGFWLPPAYKGGAGGYDVGYGVYDLFDLGEFNQKGSTPTK
jgi:alpha-amylase